MRVITTQVQQSLSQVRQLVTDDFLSSLDSADLFTENIVGNEYEFVRIALRKEDDAESPLLSWVKRGTRMMSWFARTYFSSVIIEDKPLGRFVLEDNKLPGTFTVVGFEPSTDFYGNPFYSRRIIDMAKVKTHLNSVFQTWSDNNATNEERGIANAELRANVLKVVQDQYLENGKISADAEKQFRLGRIKIKATSFLAE